MPQAAIGLSEVTGKKSLREYIYLPHKLYEPYENWVPPIYTDEWRFHDPKYNPALAHSEVVRMLAQSGGRAVGRIMGIFNPKYNAQHNQQAARFFQLDCVNNQDVAHALLKSIERWAKARKIDKLIGPFGFSDKDPQGLQIEGFEHLPVIAAPSNPPYLPGLVEAEGYEKEVDCVSLQVVLPEQVPPLFERVCRRIRRNPNIKLVEFKTKKEMKPYIIPALQLVNETFTDIFGFEQISDEEMKKLTAQYLPIVDPEFVKMTTNEKGELTGFILAIPDLSRGIQKAQGRLFPFGFLHILAARRKATQVDLLLGAIRPAARGLGVDALLGRAIVDSALKRGVKTLDSHLILESNRRMQAEYEKWGGKIYKRYRVFRKRLAE